jgi:hypothetical protein
MLVTYRLLENKQSTLEAGRAGVQEKSYVFICWMAQSFKVKFRPGSKCEAGIIRGTLDRLPNTLYSVFVTNT